ncbi:receptor-like protein kinase ANXUR2, partial [Trifolium medium]|nr:receptor-like protein kinase ANXUR2 [Trifolium medium]
RLFDLAENKSSTVEEVFLLGWEEGGDVWKWQRRLWA